MRKTAASVAVVLMTAITVLMTALSAFAQPAADDSGALRRETAAQTAAAGRNDRLLTVGGYRIAVSETGSGPDLVILHGRNYSREMMQALVDRYRDRFHVVTYDALGHGQSSRPASFTLADQSDVLAGVVEQLRLHKPSVIGFSMGSYITLLTAERHPALFSRIVLIGTRGLSGTGGAGQIFAPQTTREQILAFDRAAASPVPLTDADRESIGRSLQGFDLITDAPKATLPALVLTGRYDGLNTPAEGRRVAEALPNAQFYEIPDAGHIAFFENPDAVFKLTDAFLGAALTASAAGRDKSAVRDRAGRSAQNRADGTAKEATKMKRLITVEEHYISPAINERIKTIYEERAKNGQPVPPLAYGDIAPGSTELGAERVAYMDAHGIDAQIVSYANKIPAALEPDVSVELCRAVNNEMAEKAAAHPGRFYLFAHLPLGDPQAAAAELERCVKELGFAGAMISGHYRGLPYDDALYFPIFAKAQELDVPVYLHPSILEPAAAKLYYTGPWSERASLMLAGFGIGWHYDVGMQVVRMILAGVFDRLPDLKILIGHWGEVVSFYMYRLDEIPQEYTGLPKKVSDYFKKNIYVNPSGMLYAEQFRYCLDTFGPDHILWGEDYPYRRKENIRSFLEAFDLTDADREKIAHGNVEKLLHRK